MVKSTTVFDINEKNARKFLITVFTPRIVKWYFKILLWIFFVSGLWAQQKPTPTIFVGNEFMSRNKFPELVKFMVENESVVQKVQPFVTSFTGFQMKWFETFNTAVSGVDTAEYLRLTNIKKYAVLMERPEVLLSSHVKATQPLEDAILRFTQDKREPYVLNSQAFLICPPLPKEKADQQETVNKKIEQIAKERKVTVLPIAQFWREIEAQNDRIYLYHANDEFPSQMGSYLMACVILEMVFKIHCTHVPTTFEIPDLPGPMKFQLNPDHCKQIKEMIRLYVHNMPSAS